jgi:uncharacterized protein YkwD
MGKALIVLAAMVVATSASALDLNSFRAQHGKHRLSYSVRLAGIAYQQAAIMAGRGRIGHDNFVARIGGAGGTHAENVSYGCGSEDCAIRQWARSAGHRRNMLRGDVSSYGLASATAENGRKYWALELGGE